jgi:hypothetical protein
MFVYTSRVPAIHWISDLSVSKATESKPIATEAKLNCLERIIWVNVLKATYLNLERQ